MLYRRFILVSSLIAFLGVVLANLILITKEQRDVVREYPGLVSSKNINCEHLRSCSLKMVVRRNLV